jgi:transposase-like protein
MTLLADTTEEARRKFEELQTTSENKMAALYALQAEKDEEVIPNFSFLTQITNALNTSQELEDQLSNLKAQFLAMEADSKRLAAQTLQETDLKVYPLNSRLKPDHCGT